MDQSSEKTAISRSLCFIVPQTSDKNLLADKDLQVTGGSLLGSMVCNVHFEKKKSIKDFKNEYANKIYVNLGSDAFVVKMR